MRDRLSARSPILWAVMGLIAVAVVSLTAVALTRTAAAPVAPRTDPAFRVIVVGDDYSAGFRNRIVWPALLSQSTGWEIDNASSVGAGYVSSGDKGTFQDEVGASLDENTDAVVVFGGLADIGRPAELIEQRATDLIGYVARRSPGTRMVMIGPAWHVLPTPASISAINDAVRAAAQAMRVPFLDVAGEGWLARRGLIQSDAIHPTDSGQRVLADRLGEMLRRSGVIND